MVRSTDRPAMTIAVDLGHKATKANKQILYYLGSCIMMPSLSPNIKDFKESKL